jgi:chemotaxis protein CheD
MNLPYSTEDLPTAFENGYTSDQQQHQVTIGEYEVTVTGAELVSYGLGSCLGVALYDEKRSIAGLIHIKRPRAPSHTGSNKASFADTGLRMLFDEMQSCGAEAQDVTATLAGGSDIDGAAAAVTMDIGRKNINQAKQTLEKLGITISDTTVGGNEVMSMYFDGGSGEVTIETLS